MKSRQLFILAIALLALTKFVSGQGKLKIDPEQRYLLLSTMKTGTMQKELEDAAAQGFRIIASSSSCGQGEMVLFLDDPASNGLMIGRKATCPSATLVSFASSTS